MTERNMGRAVGVLILAGMIGITCAFLVPKSPKVDSAVAVPAPTVVAPWIPPEPEEEILEPIVIQAAHLPCEGLSSEASLKCVLKSPLDLDAFSEITLAKADLAALRERLLS